MFFSVFSILTFHVRAADVAPIANSRIAINFEKDAVAISGFPTGDTIAVIGIFSGSIDGDAYVRRESALLPDDGKTGTVRLALSYPVPLQSFVTAVDLDSGDYAVSSPRAYAWKKLPNAAILMRSDLSDLLIDRPRVDVFVVRKRVGAWHANTRSQAASNYSRFDPTSAEEIGKTPPGQRKVLPGDLVILCNTQWMEFAVLEVAAGKP